MVMQVRTLVRSLACGLVVGLAALPALAEHPNDLGRDQPHRDRPNDPGRDKRLRNRPDPSIVIEPNIDLSRSRKPDPNTPDVIMGEVQQCHAAGVHAFVDCLRGNYGPVMIRRLEACVASETIPEDLTRVAACLPRPRLR
jgi:hypothetical protein